MSIKGLGPEVLQPIDRQQTWHWYQVCNLCICIHLVHIVRYLVGPDKL